MNISYDWLKELTGTALEPQQLADRLTMVGLAVDGVHPEGEDHVLEIDLTSNRPDCLSHIGVAREVRVIEGVEVRLPPIRPQKVEGAIEGMTSVEIHDPDLCPRYAARIVRGVRVGPSPDWLAKRLSAIGQRPINNIADITNYVLHELGQPLHAFDLKKLIEERIIVRRAFRGERVTTLDGAERELDEEMLVIADAAQAVAVAGVMGGEESEISDETRDVLIESAYFNPLSVRRTSRMLGLRTEASYRFERGVDYEGTVRALNRCVSLIVEIAGGTATENSIDVYPNKIATWSVALRPEKVGAITGLRDVSVSEIERILGALGFERGGNARSADDSQIIYRVPTWRVDVEIEEDLVEEVARHIGYDRVEPTLPATSVAGEYQPHEMNRRAARGALTAEGYDEAISFSFIDVGRDGLFDLLPSLSQAGGGEARLLSLENPIIEGASRMRPTLLAGLLEAVRRNFNHETRDISLFEMGRVFAADTGGPLEREALALVTTGSRLLEGYAGGRGEIDFYDLKGALEAAITAMNITGLRFETASIKHLREGQAARIKLGGEEIGSIGRLSEEVSALFKFRQPVFVAEVDLSTLESVDKQMARYKPLARFPAAERDLSLLVERRISVEDLIDGIVDRNADFVQSVGLVDIYEGHGVPEGKRSVTLRIKYRAEERTLIDEEVDASNSEILRTLEDRFGAQLRQ